MRPEYRLLPFESKHVEFLLKEVDTRDLLAQCAGTTFSFPLTKGEIISYLEKDTIYPFVLTEQDSILGYGDLLIEPDREIRLCRLLIGKAHRHKGLGKILVQRLV